MLSIFKRLILTICFCSNILHANGLELSPLNTVPVLYEGRYTPMDAYSKHWLKEMTGAESTSPLHQALALHILGYEAFKETPLFTIQDKKLRSILQVDKKNISYRELADKIYKDKEINRKLLEPLIVSKFWETYDQVGKSKVVVQSLHPDLRVHYSQNSLTLQKIPDAKPWNLLQTGQIFTASPEQRKQNKILSDKTLSLLRSLSLFENHNPTDPYTVEHLQLQDNHVSPKEISSILNKKFPLQQRLATTSPSFYTLPAKTSPENWLPLQTIALKEYDTTANSLTPIRNFTTYSDEQFTAIQTAYLQLEKALINQTDHEEGQLLAAALIESYRTIASTPYKKTANQTLYFPSTFQLTVESFYNSVPWTTLLIIGYLLSIFFLMLPYRKIYLPPLIITFSIHTTALLLRSYLLGRPPVSNMTETVFFVPWISLITGGILTYFYKSKIPLACASAGAAILFIILKTSGMSSALENVQAVLNSQFWLTIHVLMIVGSYGAFLLAGILGHLSLLTTFSKKTQPNSSLLSKLTLQSIYLGLVLLIPGTILGGVWAAQSWGRFWDWDPKESWAFISCCTYLILVHAHYFGVIKSYGLAVGSIIGLMVIVFTWYGVNYILGTGLHSYGFGHGGEKVFYIYLIVETFFLAINSAFRYAKRPSSERRTP
jgi:ABC-type transport system involved in cytochrome c biogenesis permease subunit